MAAVTAAGGAVVRSGHLRKLKTMKKKFFVLRGDSAECSARLEYYESEKKFRGGAAPRRALPLRSCFNITRRLDLKQKHVIALFTKEEQFCVVAESEPELHEWLNAFLRLHRADDQSDQITHPIQHVWQVNVQKKGLGASKNIQGLYNLCLTDKTLTLVKIKSHNNIISELGIPERVEYALKNIRTCGDSECFFYMEVGRQTVTGAGELWMLSDDSNIAQSMHSTIYHAMRNCAKESENERDHIILPGKGTLDLSQPPPARRQTYSDGRGRAGLINDTSLRHRCDSVPARTAVAADLDKVDGLDIADDGESEWLRTCRIPEEPDWCGYVPMAPAHASSSGSVGSAGPGTLSRSEYPLEPATSLISEGGRCGRAYSVGSRPAPPAPPAPRAPARHRAYSAGARPPPPDLMELDFSVPAQQAASPGVSCRRGDVDEYVDMSPRAAPPRPAPDGYVEMSYGKRAADAGSSRSSRSEAAGSPRASPPASPRASPPATPLGSQTLFPFSPDDEHPLTTVHETMEDATAWPRLPPSGASNSSKTSLPGAAIDTALDSGAAMDQGVGAALEAGGGIAGSPAGYVRLAPTAICPPVTTAGLTTDIACPEPVVTATVVVAGAPRVPLNYAALDLEPRRVPAATPHRQYTKIDFQRTGDHA